MRSADIQEIFDPIVNRIVELIKKQIHNVQRKGERVAAIMLVGGFGSSGYLY
ncbi:Similar to hypothetical protein [Tuber melanosporum Mel28]; acc. no. XP_002840605 [Pyronema omphalodes CBS 100304]|uniref:Uncharacterized protein n=1 Tax=Pyronema omphalodes (strain CBS 100304) TaxID=1076935 RepID=U4LQB0_PYROM|nr:Similar to hypothetical protein [Tuber melanosporum Mel28]; acc. no. XP_002840605 [Pyronema omphalodes CBS 100304]